MQLLYFFEEFDGMEKIKHSIAFKISLDLQLDCTVHLWYDTVFAILNVQEQKMVTI